MNKFMKVKEESSNEKVSREDCLLALYPSPNRQLIIRTIFEDLDPSGIEKNWLSKGFGIEGALEAAFSYEDHFGESLNFIDIDLAVLEERWATDSELLDGLIYWLYGWKNSRKNGKK